jgi:hypothetical protein
VAPVAGAYWPYRKLVASLAGRTLVLPSGSVRLDASLLECNGEGSPVKDGRSREWSRYICTQTLFRGGVDRDVTFAVAIRNGSEVRIISPHYGSE